MDGKNNKRMKFNTDYIYLMPAVLFIGGFFVSSILFTVNLSFFEWDGFSPMKFVGIANYVKLFRDPNFIISCLNTIIWVVCSLVVSLVVPLLLAILITKSFWHSGFKNIFYFPTALSGTVGGLVIATILSLSGLPQIFKYMGMDELVYDWLSIPYVNTLIMIVMGLWQGIGLNILLFISGLNSMDKGPIEAAKIEGAGVIQLYTKVIFHLLKPTIIVVFLMSLVNSFKVFDSIWIMTKGGPYRTSETLALTMYLESFAYGRLGAGAAVAVVLTIVILIVSYFNVRNTFKED
ncbi:MAG: sugar ABC transporter permease [Hungatella sp.]